MGGLFVCKHIVIIIEAVALAVLPGTVLFLSCHHQSQDGKQQGLSALKVSNIFLAEMMHYYKSITQQHILALPTRGFITPTATKLHVILVSEAGNNDE